jgi:pectinesterase
LRSELGEHIKREGWHDWNKEEARSYSFYAEYENFGPGASGEREPWCHKLTAEEAAEYEKRKVLRELFEAGLLE